ncbi:MAG: hypothetical protein EOP47_11880 [Sphingobacteriaceae bacterium]|nr:MAG: hypothetical protein EOP47_11880 [Sphingobacteriaceae bacterium]
MKKIIPTLLLILLIGNANAQSRFSKNEISINGFRNPSIGAEFRHHEFSVHAGYYPTAFKSGENTNFFKAGFTLWFLPVGKKENPSSFYIGSSYLRGFNRDYEGKNALGTEAGFRWMIWQRLNLRLGVIGVSSKGQSFKVNPAPGISYSFFIK